MGARTQSRHKPRGTLINWFAVAVPVARAAFTIPCPVCARGKATFMRIPTKGELGFTQCATIEHVDYMFHAERVALAALLV